MKRWIALLLSALMLFSLTACDEDKEKYDEEYEIFVNGSEEWHPFPGKTNVEFSVSDEYVIACQTTPSKISFTGKQVGKSVITAKVDGEEKKALVEVKRMVAKDDDEDNEDIVINYAYNPPTDNYYLCAEYSDTDTVWAVGRIGNIFAEYYDSSDRSYRVYYDDESQMGYEYDVAEQHWQMYMNDAGDAKYSYNMFLETKEDGELDPTPLISSFEGGFMSLFRQYGLDESKLAQYYVGTETFLGVECWVFDGKGLNSNESKYWVDPSNGCTLKVVDEDGCISQLTQYDLNYTEWSSDLMP